MSKMPLTLTSIDSGSIVLDFAKKPSMDTVMVGGVERMRIWVNDSSYTIVEESRDEIYQLYTEARKTSGEIK